ncbi:MAG: FmdB family zinc ribbon protein [Vulcanimicrobiota bacterium]
MPIYEYRAVSSDNSCDFCREKFEKMHKFNDPLLESCPMCENPVKKLISNVKVTFGMDYKAKKTGLHKLVKRDKGTYEKMY